MRFDNFLKVVKSKNTKIEELEILSELSLE